MFLAFMLSGCSAVLYSGYNYIYVFTTVVEGVVLAAIKKRVVQIRTDQ